MHVKSGTALVVERLGHERGEQVLLPRDLLHSRLQPERAVRGVGHARMPEVDLELTGRELVVGGGDLQTSVSQLPEHAQEQSAGITLAPHNVDVPQVVRVPSPAAVGVSFADEELQLRPADEAVSKAGDLSGDPPYDRARRLRGWLAVRGGRVTQAPGGVGLPRQTGQRGKVGPD